MISEAQYRLLGLEGVVQEDAHSHSVEHCLQNARVCTVCKVQKWGCEFYQTNRHHCKECMRKKDRESGRTRHWRKRGLVDFTQDDYDRMLKEQDGKCAICDVAECTTGRAFAADHNHLTGKVRGLLCAKCNYLLGRVKDDPTLLMKAATYLLERNGEQS